MPRRTVQQLRRLALALGAVAAVLIAFAQSASPADAQSAYVEVRLAVTVTTYTRPDLTSPVFATLPAGTLVNGIGRMTGPDGTVFVQVTRPDRTALGFMRASDFRGGSSADIFVLPVLPFFTVAPPVLSSTVIVSPVFPVLSSPVIVSPVIVSPIFVPVAVPVLRPVVTPIFVPVISPVFVPVPGQIPVPAIRGPVIVPVRR